MIIVKGNAPLCEFSFKTNNKKVVPIPTDASKFTLWIHDAVSVRHGAGTISNINSSAGTCQYQSSALDWANEGDTVAWCDVDLGEPAPRTFAPRKITVIDPTQV